MKFYCRRQPVGEFLRIPDSWRIKNLHYEKGFIPIEKLHGYRDEKLPYFMSIVTYSLIESLTELCCEIPKFILGEQPNFWLLYYYSLDNICLLAAEENYFSGLDYEIIEV